MKFRGWMVGASGLLLFACLALPTGLESETVYSESPPTWFEDGMSWGKPASDGKWAVYWGRRRVELVDLETGRTDAERLKGNLDTAASPRKKMSSAPAWTRPVSRIKLSHI